MKFLKKYFLICTFLSFLLVFGAASTYKYLKNKTPLRLEYEQSSLFDLDRKLKREYLHREEEFGKHFYKKLFFVEKYGKIQRWLGKKLVDDSVDFRRVYQGEQDMLYYIITKKNIVKKSVDSIVKLKEALQEKGTEIHFILAPNKHNKISSAFPENVLDYAQINASEIDKSLKEAGIKVLNLNEEFVKDGMSEVEYFYKTDTHWKNKTAFWGYAKVLEFMKEELGYAFDNEDDADDISNYHVENYPEIYIGSMGKRAGVDYVPKKDDYTLLLPKFDTKYRYQKFDDGGNLVLDKKGNFEEVFVNREVLASTDPYMDHYIAMMGYGQAHEIITNENVGDMTKIALIKDSFAMPLSAYLSANVHSLYLFDTRYENVRKNIVEMVDEIRPDHVFFVCSPTTFFYFPNMFEF